MRRIRRSFHVLFLIILAVLIFVSAFTSLAATTSTSLSWWTVDGGGVLNQGSDGYTLGGTAGQPDAGVLLGGSYTLNGGFWAGAHLIAQQFYLPVINK